jgi:trk system potassium uptake protein TrkH
MFILLIIVLVYTLFRNPGSLKGIVGMLFLYLICMMGLSTLFRYAPEPIGVRILLLAGSVPFAFLVSRVPLFSDDTVKKTVLYFFALTGISTCALFVTEGDRLVHGKRPAMEETSISKLYPDGSSKELRRERHTFVEDVEYVGEPFIDCWFTAVSAACVTGTIVTDTAAVTLLGQIVILITIQAGGLGIIFYTALHGAVDKKRALALDMLNAEALGVDVAFSKRMLGHVIQYTVVLECLGIVIMGIHLQWFADQSLLKGINPWWWATFHSISAFNNAGFSLMADNLMGFVKDPVINLTIGSLIILGGLGYPVLIRIWVWIRVQCGGRNGKTSELIKYVEAIEASRLQTYMVIWITVLLLKLGTVAPLVFDWDNPTFADLSVGERILCAFFQSVSARTAGFNTVDLGQWSTVVLLIYCSLMYIGASPAGTGGGIKTTTLGLLWAYVANFFRPELHPVIVRFEDQDRSISRKTMRDAVKLFVASLGLLGMVTLGICIFERRYLLTPDPTFNYLKILFETCSCFGTVGLSMGFEGAVTSFATILTDDSKMMLIITMLIGRMGPLSILSLFPWRKPETYDPQAKPTNVTVG